MIPRFQIPPMPEIEDILPPIPDPSLPAMVWVGGGALLLALLVFAAFYFRNRTAQGPDLRALALRDLDALAVNTETADAYGFSIRACDILRGYCEARFGLPASRQTSPEFLADMRDHPEFAPEERSALARFLEKCDAVKFGRAPAGAEDNRFLVRLARELLSGGAP